MIDRQFFGGQLIEIDEVDSTNLHAQRMLKKQKVVEGTVINAKLQTEGRGQMGTRWYSGDGDNLTFSLILYPRFLNLEKQFYLSKVIAIGIVEAIEKLSIFNVKIKWPNDIYLGKEKVSGILIENSVRGQEIEHSVVGVGVNINEEDFGMYGLSATSLAMEAGETMDTGYLLKSLLKCMEKWYLMLRAEKYFEIDDAYQQKLLNYNQWAYYEKDDQVIKAKIIGVKNYGNIVLENELGDIFEYGLKELKFII